jgi:cob(I)alamin adenosyltransferase
MGIQDLNKLKKRLFDSEFKIIEERYKEQSKMVGEALVMKYEGFVQEVRTTLEERSAFIENFAS